MRRGSVRSPLTRRPTPTRSARDPASARHRVTAWPRATLTSREAARAHDRRRRDRRRRPTATSSPRSATTTRASSRRASSCSTRPSAAAPTPSSCRSATTARSTRATFFNKPYDNENAYGPTYGDAPRGARVRPRRVRGAEGVRGRARHHVLRDGVRLPSADFLAELDMPAYKIASADLTNMPLLRHVAADRQADDRLDRRRRRSTTCGARYDAVAEINPQVAILQCTAGYPADLGGARPARDRDLPRSSSPRRSSASPSHDNGIAMAVAAYVLGARIVEKHFTLNRALKGTDHALLARAAGPAQDGARPAAHARRARRRRQEDVRRARSSRSRRWPRSSSPRATCRPATCSSRGHRAASRRATACRRTSSTRSSGRTLRHPVAEDARVDVRADSRSCRRSTRSPSARRPAAWRLMPPLAGRARGRHRARRAGSGRLDRRARRARAPTWSGVDLGDGRRRGLDART